MATVREAIDTREAVKRLTQRQLSELLDDLPGVRAWLGGGKDPHLEGAGAILSSREAAELLGVERQRLWRWEKAGRIARVATNNATPLYMRVDVERLAAEEAERPGARRRQKGAA